MMSTRFLPRFLRAAYRPCALAAGVRHSIVRGHPYKGPSRTPLMAKSEDTAQLKTDLIELRQRADGMKDRLVEIRRDLHRHPELGFEEVRTAGIIEEALRKMEGVEAIRTGVAKTGVVASIFGSKPCGVAESEHDSWHNATKRGPVVLLRADMDGLPMEEENDSIDYQSTIPGKAHTCGHDAHVACLLGAAELLVERRHTFSGEVRLVFQPAEETTGGALPMIKEGVASCIDAALSLHVMTYNEVGTVAVREGHINASENNVFVKIIGEGGHASQPHLAVNPVNVACNIAISLQGFLTRTVCATKHVVLTVSHINSGSRKATNVIPDTCTFSGTLRTFDPSVRAELIEKIPQFIKSMASSFGAEAEVKVSDGYASGSNSKFVVDAVRKVTTVMYGENALEEIPDPEMGSEDFFYFSLDGKVPVCQYWLGGANEERGITADNHCPNFDMDEDCLPMGAGTLAGGALMLSHRLSHPTEPNK